MRTKKMGDDISSALITGVEANRHGSAGIWKLDKIMRSTSGVDGIHLGLIKYPANSTGGI